MAECLAKAVCHTLPQGHYFTSIESPFEARMKTTTVLALLAIATGVATLCLGVLPQLRPAPVRPAVAEARLGNIHLRYDSRYLRSPGERSNPGGDRLELVAAMPDFTPAGDRMFGLPPENLVFLTLEPAGTTLDPSERPARLYARFLEEEIWSHPGDLIMRRFVADSPYEHEDLYMAPPEGRAFFARCMHPSPAPDRLQNSCISEMRVAGLDIQMRFSPEQLAFWDRMVIGARLLAGARSR